MTFFVKTRHTTLFSMQNTWETPPFVRMREIDIQRGLESLVTLLASVLQLSMEGYMGGVSPPPYRARVNRRPDKGAADATPLQEFFSELHAERLETEG